MRIRALHVETKGGGHRTHLRLAEVDLYPLRKASGLQQNVNSTDHEPECPCPQCGGLQSEEDHQTKNKTGRWHKKVQEQITFHVLRSAEAKMSQRHCVHCHERQERSKIQDLHRALPTHRQRARIGEKANDGHVVTWVSAVDSCMGYEIALASVSKWPTPAGKFMCSLETARI